MARDMQQNNPEFFENLRQQGAAAFNPGAQQQQDGAEPGKQQ